MATVNNQIDQLQKEAFSERILADVNSAMSAFTIYLGHKLGLSKPWLKGAGNLRRTGPEDRVCGAILEGVAGGPGHIDKIVNLG